MFKKGENEIETARTNLFVYTSTIFVSINLRIGITSVSPLLETIRQDLNISNFPLVFNSYSCFCMGTFALLTGKVIKNTGQKNQL